nr:zinc finger BED domain-containing protein RICESLEEPER 2-like [Tanacetum cinerariifolium]
MKEKLKKYFERMPPIITCAAALNLCFNVHSVEFLIESITTDLEFFDDSYATKAKKWFTDPFEGLYIIYYAKYGNLTTTESSNGGGGSLSRTSDGNQMTTLLRRLKKHKNKKAGSDPSLSVEYERCVHLDFVTHLQTTEFATFDVVGFWKAKETMFPVLSPMAIDILSVQATSVASESAFSKSGRVLSIQRTRLTLASLEMCMCLKDHLDAQERKQDKSTLETPVDFEEEILDAEILVRQATVVFFRTNRNKLERRREYLFEGEMDKLAMEEAGFPNRVSDPCCSADLPLLFSSTCRVIAEYVI